MKSQVEKLALESLDSDAWEAIASALTALGNRDAQCTKALREEHWSSGARNETEYSNTRLPNSGPEKHQWTAKSVGQLDPEESGNRQHHSVRVSPPED